MTACIVGWAHSRFGKLDGETIESLITRVAADAIAMFGSPWRRYDSGIIRYYAVRVTAPQGSIS